MAVGPLSCEAKGSRTDARHAGDRCLVKDVVHAFRRPTAYREIRDVHRDPLESTFEIRQVGKATRGEIVDRTDRVALTQQCLDQMGTDEPGPSFRENALGFTHSRIPHGPWARTIVALVAITMARMKGEIGFAIRVPGLFMICEPMVGDKVQEAVARYQATYCSSPSRIGVFVE